MGNKNTLSRVKIFISALIFMSVSVIGALASIIDYLGLITKSDIITFSTRSAWFIWCSPLCMYISLLLFKSILNNNKVALSNKKKITLSHKIGGAVTFISIIGFVFTLFFSFYVDFTLKHENYITCAKSSWIAPNKYVKDIALCK
ncbi:DUF1240 domain-containing protein [Xenorhabdus kozodoii]|uniref:Membrane protein n=1 Tax=Xenorhabdus kozodoii TaxID=351676 RepID=A0A2D0LF40_9GAMM|nr:DUF1240 domain-containing protein [Xenorhabdus kozodoii]PHM74037.1 membrane protein [Xenorhabdus kozodoii]